MEQAALAAQPDRAIASPAVAQVAAAVPKHTMIIRIALTRMVLLALVLILREFGKEKKCQADLVVIKVHIRIWKF